MASIIQFRFPECPKIPLSSIVTRASQQGIQFLVDLLSWDPDKRPNAQQSLKVAYFNNVKNAPSAVRPTTIQKNTNPNGRLSIMEVEAMDNNGLFSRFNGSQKYNSNTDLNELNSILSSSRLTQNNDKPMIISANPLISQSEPKSSAKAFIKYQSNYNIINDMFNNMKTDKNNNENNIGDKNSNQGESLFSSIEVPQRRLERAEEPPEKEKVNDVFINLLKDQKDPLDFSNTLTSNASFYLHEPKQLQKQKRNDSSTSFMMMPKNVPDNSFDEGFFDSLNSVRRSKAPSGKEVIKRLDNGADDDELASILG